MNKRQNEIISKDREKYKLKKHIYHKMNKQHAQQKSRMIKISNIHSQYNQLSAILNVITQGFI